MAKKKSEKRKCICVTEIDSEFSTYMFCSYSGVEAVFFRVEDIDACADKYSSYAFGGCGGCNGTGYLPPPDEKDEQIRKLTAQLESAREEIAELKKRAKKSK